MVRERMGQLLLEAQLISQEQVQQALKIQQSRGCRLGSILVEMGAVSESQLLQFLSQQYGVPTVDLSTCEIDLDVLTLVPFELVQKYLVLPVRRVESRLTVAMVDPSNLAVMDEMKFRTGLHVVPMVARESDIVLAIRRVYGQNSSSKNIHQSVKGDESRSCEKAGFPKQKSFLPTSTYGQNTGAAEAEGPSGLENLQVWLRQALSSLPHSDQSANCHDLLEEKAPLVNLVNGLLRQAAEVSASDIHIEPYESSVRVRFRLDGVLRTVMNLPLNLRNAVITRIKIMSNLDIAERRLPQDGRMNLKSQGSRKVDVRVSILPCLHGEKAVLRLLDQSSLGLDITKLGLSKQDLETVLVALEQPDGLILVTGPTGSGKTTTLYSALQFLNTPNVNVVTVEDPVEYHLTGINQLQIKEDIGLTFAAGLRSFLRQDPDILMVGEIRDRETAHIAIQAALTGHRVLSTLHTNDAVRTVTRLIDMGIEPFLVSSALSLIIAQRLVRKICDHCKEPDLVSHAQLMLFGLSREDMDGIVPMRGRGCVRCHDTGYKGRLGLFEVLPLSESLHVKILERAPANDLKRCAIQSGVKTLRQNGLSTIKLGMTTVDEVLGSTVVDRLT